MAPGVKKPARGRLNDQLGQLARLIGQVKLDLGQGSCELMLPSRNSIGQVIRVITGQDSWPIGPGRIRATNHGVVIATVPIMANTERVAPMRTNVNSCCHCLDLRVLRLGRIGPGPTIDVTAQ